MLDLTPAERALLHAVLRKHGADLDVWAYGSRTRGGARCTSDLDLLVGLAGGQPVALLALQDLRDALSESDLPMRVDVVDRSACAVDFLTHIAPDLVRIQSAALRHERPETSLNS